MELFPKRSLEVCILCLRPLKLAKNDSKDEATLRGWSLIVFGWKSKGCLNGINFLLFDAII